MKYLLLLALSTHYICTIGALCILYSVHLLNGSYIILRQSQSSHYFDIHKIGFIIIGIT